MENDKPKVKAGTGGEWFRWVDIPMFLIFALLLVPGWVWDTRHALGLSLTVLGFVLWIAARLQLGRSFSVRAEARTLVTTGLYSKFRNPIYFFAGVAYLGLMIMWGNVIGLLFFLAIYPTFQYLRIKKESAVLEKAFGEDYRRYKARTWF